MINDKFEKIKQKLEDKKIVILLGGNSPEREVSLNSGDEVYKELKSLNLNVTKFDPLEKNLDQLINNKPNLVFIITHGSDGENGRIQAILEYHGIKHTTSQYNACAFTMDKATTKKICQFHDLKTAKFITTNKYSKLTDYINKLQNFKFPIAVKPNYGGSSINVHKIANLCELKKLLIEINNSEEWLIEEWLQGEEITVGFIGDAILPPITIDVIGYYDYNNKYKSNSTKYFATALNDKELSKLNKICKIAINSVNASVWGRIDFIRKNNEFYLLEINLVPGLTKSSLIPKATSILGYNFKQTLLLIINEVI